MSAEGGSRPGGVGWTSPARRKKKKPSSQFTSHILRAQEFHTPFGHPPLSDIFPAPGVRDSDWALGALKGVPTNILEEGWGGDLTWGKCMPCMVWEDYPHRLDFCPCWPKLFCDDCYVPSAAARIDRSVDFSRNRNRYNGF